jgi:hypothetical protein
MMPTALSPKTHVREGEKGLDVSERTNEHLSPKLKAQSVP